MPKKGKKQSLRIVHRYHFASSLKRMSAVVSVQTPGSSLSTNMATVKGTPETLRSMVSFVLRYFCSLVLRPVHGMPLPSPIFSEVKADLIDNLHKGLIFHLNQRRQKKCKFPERTL